MRVLAPGPALPPAGGQPGKEREATAPMGVQLPGVGRSSTLDAGPGSSASPEPGADPGLLPIAPPGVIASSVLLGSCLFCKEEKRHKCALRMKCLKNPWKTKNKMSRQPQSSHKRRRGEPQRGCVVADFFLLCIFYYNNNNNN